MKHALVIVFCMGMLTACGSSNSTSRGDNQPAVTCRLLAATETPAGERRRTGDDVYILHGLASDAVAMQPLIDRVIELGIYRRVYALEYRDDLSIRVTGHELSRIVRANSPVSCDLVGHSLGGLVIRWALEQSGLGPLTRKAWLIGTPNLGSSLAVIGAGGSLTDLQPDSETLRILNNGPRVVNAAYSYLTIAGDLVVAGQRTGTDGVVPVIAANWSGLGLHARALTRSWVNASHFGLKSSPAALDQLAMMMRVQSSLQ